MKIRTLSVAVYFIATLFFSTHAGAIPLYVYDSAGKVTGITGLVSGGTTWDMELHDLSFDDLLAPGEPSPLYATSFAEQITKDLVDFLNSDGNNLDPDAYLGCTVFNGCFIATAYNFLPDEGIAYTHVANISIETIFGFPQPPSTSYGIASVYTDTLYAGITYATWSVSGESVPEPTILLLLCTGLLGIFGLARRKVRT